MIPVTIFSVGDKAVYSGYAQISYTDVLCSGDIVSVTKANEDVDDDVIVNFRGSSIIVSAHDLIWLAT